MKKKILFIITKSSWGGAQRYVYDIATNLPKDEYEPVVAAGGDDILFKKLTEAGIRTIAVKSFERDIHITKEFRAAREILSLYTQERPSVIHLNSSKAGGIGAAAAWIYKRTPENTHPLVVFTAHGWGFHEPRPFISKIAIFLASFFASLFQDIVICITKKDARAAQYFIPKRKIAIVPNGIREFPVYTREESRRALLGKTGISHAPKGAVIGTIAELTKNKGYRYLLEALSLLRGEGIQFHAVWIGDGELRDTLAREIAHRNLQTYISQIAYVKDAARYLAAFDIFVLPSLKEGLPYTILEAMAAGIPVIGTRVGGIPDCVRPGVSGVLVSPGSGAEIADAIKLLLSNETLQKSLAKRAKNVVQQLYTLDRMIHATKQIYAAKT